MPEGDSTWEIRCLVMTNASLATRRPLSGFLLKPVDILDGRTSRGTKGARSDSQHHADETRLALFDAFPVGDDGETTPPGGTHTP